MKGKATFTLKEAATGRVVREFTEHNIVTDAAANIFALPRNAIMGNYIMADFIESALPLYKNIFGGIMLLGNTLEEKKDNIMLPTDCIPVATAGDDYSGDMPTRGSRNLNESYETANGYHFTWDFGTDKANGTIKSVALTSRAFGNCGFGVQDGGKGFILSPMYLKPQTITPQIFAGKGQYIATVAKCTHIYMQEYADRVITFAVVKTIDPENILINDFDPLSKYKDPERTIEVTLPFDHHRDTRPFVDTKNKRVLFSSDVTAVSDNTYKIDYAWVSYENFSVTTGSWPLGDFSQSFSTLAIHNKRLYAYSQLTLCEFDSGGNLLRTWEKQNIANTTFYMIGDILSVAELGKNLSVYINGDFMNVNNWSNYSLFGSADIKPPYYAATIMTNLTRIYDYNPYLVLAGNYLATINNLSEPIEKTSEHTLKITYDITN